MPYACWISAKPSKLKLATIDNGFYQIYTTIHHLTPTMLSQLRQQYTCMVVYGGVWWSDFTAAPPMRAADRAALIVRNPALDETRAIDKARRSATLNPNPNAHAHAHTHKRT
jgi:hypothetical protein